MDPKVILITGASGGMGYRAAEALAKQGHIVYGAARRVEKIAPLISCGVHPLHLDVTDADSCTAVVKRVVSEQGRIDVLINNAGYGSFGAIEDVTSDEAHRQFEVNVFGLAELTKRVLPYMRMKGRGRIINVGSVGGRLVSYLGGWYHATKYSVEALSDALRMELSDFGIDVVLIEPGFIKTNWPYIATDHLEASSHGGVYEHRAVETARSIRGIYNGPIASRPSVVVKAILKAVNVRRPKPRYLVGAGAHAGVFWHSVLPTRVFDFIIKRMM